MNESQIQIQFPSPGVWDKFTMTAIFPGKGEFMQSCTYTQDDIPADQAPAISAVVAALVGLGEDWQASQVWARLEDFINFDRRPDEPPSVDSIWLSVEAVNDQGGRSIFTADDYPDFIILDPAAVAFFKHFTKIKNND